MCFPRVNSIFHISHNEIPVTHTHPCIDIYIHVYMLRHTSILVVKSLLPQRVITARAKLPVLPIFKTSSRSFNCFGN